MLFLGFEVFSQNDFQNNGDFRLHTGAKIGFFGNVTNNGTMTNNLGEVHFVGNSKNILNGSNKIQGYDIHLNNNNNIQLDNQLEVTNTLFFTSGKIESDTADASSEFVNFLAGSEYSGATDSKHIDGVVRKTGNTAFIFPVGADDNLQTIAIASPSNLTDHFTAYYIEASPAISGYTRTDKVVALDHVSNCEYWILNRTGGVSSVNVTLGFDVNSCGITNILELLVARWDGSTWQNHDNGGTTGTIVAGTIQTSAAVTEFSPFTLGSTISNNPLPIELLSFEVEKKQNYALITWVTTTEINNDFFELEKSTDGLLWDVINRQEGAGNSTTVLNYEYQDDNLINGIQYYRLKQTDFDGKFTYSDIIAIKNIINEASFLIYPNPLNQESLKVLLKGISDNEFFKITILDITGKLLYTKDFITEIDNNSSMLITISKKLLKGSYTLRITHSAGSYNHKLIVN